MTIDELIAANKDTDVHTSTKQLEETGHMLAHLCQAHQRWAIEPTDLNEAIAKNMFSKIFDRIADLYLEIEARDRIIKDLMEV